ncbi:MAG: DMT family transporter [Phycisphaerales bacterium]
MWSITEHTGEVAALAAAMCWALSTVLYRPIGYKLSPVLMNLFKGLIASAMLVVMIGAGWLLWGGAIGGMGAGTAALLAISGVIGIGVGDTLFFASLRHVGSRRAMLLATLSPPLTALIGLVFLHEVLSVASWLGIVLTVSGIAWVITERSNLKGPVEVDHRVGLGVLCGVLCAVTQALSAVISRKAMDGTEAGADLAALVRIAAGTASVALILPLLRVYGSAVKAGKPKLSARGWALFTLAVSLGTFLGIWLFQIALDHTSAGVAQTLVSTGTLFVLPIAALMGERVSPRAIAGAVLAVGGIVLLFSNG